MYTAHFGLSAPPFAITPDPRFLYMSDRHREGLAHLLYGIRQPGGFVQLTGEVGTGKTTLCRCLLEQLPPDVDAALILTPQVTPLELLATLCDELRIFYPAGGLSLKLLSDALQRYLLRAHARGRRTVLIVDEAQNLSPEVLEQIRLLTNLETATEKLLQIILIGQPELIRMLERPQLRQLAQRITARYHLQPFALRDTAACVAHRLRVSGGASGLFTPAALYAVHRWSGGLPRLINVICDRALLGAYTEDARRITAGTVRRAAREVRGERARSARLLRPARAVLLAAVAGGLVAGGFLAASPERLPGLLGVLRAAKPPPDLAVVPSTPAPLPVAPPPPLPELLAEASRERDRGAAYVSLFTRWGLAPEQIAAGHGGGCEAARAAGLICTSLAGSWDRIRRLDLPVLLRMAAPSGRALEVPLISLGAATATLELAGRRPTYPHREIEPFWKGSFLVAWKPPSSAPRLLAPGARGKEVLWLRARLAAALGLDAGAAPSDLYDRGLAELVRRFQRAHALAPDGIAGEETLLHLGLAVREPGTPTLGDARP